MGDMNKNLLVAVCVLLMLGTAFGAPIISFSPGSSNPGKWNYDGVNTLSFTQMVTVDQGAGSNTDTLVTFGARVYIPNLVVGGIPVAPYTLTPASRTFEIKSADGLTTYLSGTLAPSDLVPVGTGAMGYTGYNADITNVVINNTIGSNALALIASSGKPLDFNLGLSSTVQNFDYMLDNGIAGSDDFSGVLGIVPEPASALLIGTGLFFARLVRRQS